MNKIDVKDIRVCWFRYPAIHNDKANAEPRESFLAESVSFFICS